MADASLAKTKSFGLDGALWKKIDGKFNGEKAKDCLQWVKDVTGANYEVPDTVDSECFLDTLHNGYYLALLAEKIDPDCWKKVNQKKFKPKNHKSAFPSRNQIEVFTKACRTFGVKENDLFTSQDLYNRENPNNVISLLMSLNGNLHNHATFEGPFMDSGYKAATENKREFDEETIRKGKCIVPNWSKGSLAVETGPSLDSAGIVKTAGNEDWKASGEVPAWNKGSIAHKTGPQLDSAGIVKTAGNEDWKHSNEASVWQKGSIQHKGGRRLDHIIKTTDSGSSVIPKLSQGVKQHEHKSNFDAHGIIKHA